MRIGEVAQRAGVNIETLRYYERRGLLPEPGRSPFGHRSYDEDAVRFVRAIKDAQSLGFTLAEIEEHLRLTRGGGTARSESVRVRLAAKIDEVDGKIASLKRVRDELARILGCACDSLDHCTCGAAYLARRGRDPEPLEHGTLHVTNGESAANTLRRTTLGGAVLSWNDTLTEGPVPRVPPEQLRDRRARFLSECGWGSRRAILHALERRDLLLGQALAEDRHVVLWFEHDLYDQLQLLQVLALAGEVGHDPKRMELVNPGSVLGPMDERELEALWPGRRAVTPELLAVASECWDAVRAHDPLAVEQAPAADGLPFLAAALRRLLEQLPDTRTGLSRSERQLLAPLAAGPRTPHELFAASAAAEDAPFDGDTWVWKRIAELGSSDERLLELAAGGPVPPPPPRGEAHGFAALELVITGAGRDVLAGRADRVELLGIDRWVGGTHLEPGNLWRWDRRRVRVTKE